MVLPILQSTHSGYGGRLEDLGRIVGEEYRGILRDPENFDTSMPGVTAGFTEHAMEYSERFDNTDYYRWLLRNTFRFLEWSDFSSPRRILDLGVGSGSSTQVLLEMFPNAEVVACDISAQMLQLVRQRLAKQPGMPERCISIQLDSERLRFQPNHFDLVVGMAMLHHLFHPERAIQQSFHALKLGGHAIFFDPFEPGKALLGLAAREIAERLQCNRLALLPHRILGRLTRILGRLKLDGLVPKPKVITLINTLLDYANGIAVMAQRDKTLPIFQRLDDKWIFTKDYLEEQGGAAGFSRTWTIPIAEVGPNYFENQARCMLREQRLDGVMPQWAWNVFGRLDRAFSAEFKQELFAEGAAIYRK
jgi:SAM-dependent methyltransferase